MSNDVYPVLPGLAFTPHRQPIWKTQIQAAMSGKETRIRRWSSPKYQYTLNYEFLRENKGFTEFQALFGFFNLHGGSFDTWLFTDPDDHTAVGQQIGVGDGSTKAFQLSRAFGGFVDVVKNPNVVSHVYVNGVSQPSGWTVDSSTGIVTFTTAPANGLPIAADFTFYWRCRFVDDQIDFDKFSDKIWELQQVDFITVK
jgi:uncharacterized protein (TIGR02217 family)